MIDDVGGKVTKLPFSAGGGRPTALTPWLICHVWSKYVQPFCPQRANVRKYILTNIRHGTKRPVPLSITISWRIVVVGLVAVAVAAAAVVVVVVVV